MSPALRHRTTALVAVLAETGLSSAAAAHGDHRHHHHSHKKKKAYNKGYRQGYRRAIEYFYRTYYRNYSPMYGLIVSPMLQRVIVAPAPWIVPVHPHRQGTWVNVGIGFNL